MIAPLLIGRWLVLVNYLEGSFIHGKYSVAGLHVNPFKPHTGTKTSVLFFQKWNDDPKSQHDCPKVEDYPIFFATSEQSGRDNSGDYLCKIGEDGRAMLDGHGHLVIDHDLDEVAAALIEALIEFAQAQKFSFWREG